MPKLSGLLVGAGLLLAGMPAEAQYFWAQFPNEAGTGTQVAHLAKLTGAPSTAIISTAGDTSGAVGVVTGWTGSDGKSGSALIARSGVAACAFDGATTAGHYVQISASVNGDCTDGGASYPTSGQILGRVLSTNGGAGTFNMTVAGPEIQGAAGATAIVPGTTTITGATAPCLIENSTGTTMACPGVGTGVITALGNSLSGAGGVTSTIASGTSALGTSAISSATCATVVTTAATNTATTDVVTASFNGDPTGVTGYIPATAGMLTIISYPTSGNVNFKVCNNTSSSVTPGAITLNWRVVR